MKNPQHLKKTVQGDYRLIVVSDIHGHLDRFQRLLEKVKYTPEDYLVILGDFTEKGEQVIETIHYMRTLSQNERTFILAGNCEWAVMVLLTVPELANQIPYYLKKSVRGGCIHQVYHQLHLDQGNETTLGIQKQIAEYLKDELQFLSSLPVTLDFNQFLFVHAGLDSDKDYRESSLETLLETKYFYEKGHHLDKMVVVGHIPVSLYYSDYICNDIIIDEEKKIICIDGGTGVKAVSQLNALIIESKQGKIKYTPRCIQEDLPLYRVKTTIQPIQNEVHKVVFPDFEVKIEHVGEQFSQCYQVATKQRLAIKNEFLYERDQKTYCLDDYIDYRISASKGDVVKILGIYDQYAYVSHLHHVGWIPYDHLEAIESE